MITNQWIAKLSKKHVKPALDYALDTINAEDDFLDNFSFEMEFGDSKCSKDAKLTASDLYYGNTAQGNPHKGRTRPP